jgi:hypothetical protein
MPCIVTGYVQGQKLNQIIPEFKNSIIINRNKSKKGGDAGAYSNSFSEQIM